MQTEVNPDNESEINQTKLILGAPADYEMEEEEEEEDDDDDEEDDLDMMLEEEGEEEDNYWVYIQLAHVNCLWLSVRCVTSKNGMPKDVFIGCFCFSLSEDDTLIY